MITIAIIGAGLAGVSLAQRLQQAGYRVVLFEKSRGLGGRLATRRCDDWQADHGAQYFTARSAEFCAEVAQWVAKGWVQPWPLTAMTLINGQFSASADSRTRYVGVPTMNAMVRGLAGDIECHRNCKIVQLRREGRGWLLSDAEGVSLGPFDAVVSSAPVAQTAALLPKAVQQHLRLSQAAMLPTWAVALALSAPLGISANALFVQEGIIRWAAQNSLKPGRPNRYETWVVHFDSAWTQDNLEHNQSALTAHVSSLLADWSGVSPQIEHALQHRWLYARAVAPAEPLPCWDPDSCLGIAGDWVMGERVEDAWRSAMQVAAAIERHFSAT